MNEAHQALVRRHLEAENAHRMKETLETLHPDCVFEDMALGQVFHGRAGAEAYYRQWWDAFDVTVGRAAGQNSYWAEDGTRIAEACFTGTHVGEFLGLAPTGRPIELRFVVVIGLRDGLMAGERFYYDAGTLLKQLGAARFPALDTAPSKRPAR